MADEKEGFFTGSEENEDISLSESELANILGDAVTVEASPSAGESVPTIDDIESSPVVPLGDDDPPVLGVTPSEDMPALEASRGLDDVVETGDDEKLTVDDAAIDLDNLPDASDISLEIGGDDAPSAPAKGGEEGFFTETEDETISLSDGELENILADVGDAAPAAELDIPTMPDNTDPMPSLEPEAEVAPEPVKPSKRKPSAGVPDDIFSMDAGDEIIALSGDELNEILSDEEARREREDSVRERPAAEEPEIVDVGDIDHAAIQDDIDELSRKMDAMPVLEPDLPPAKKVIEPITRSMPLDNTPADLSAPLDDADIAKLQKEAQRSSNVMESLSFENEIMKESGVEAPTFDHPMLDEPEIPELPIPDDVPVVSSAIPDETPPPAKKGNEFDGTITEDDLSGALRRFENEVLPAAKAASRGGVTASGEGVKELLVYFDDLLANLPEEKIKRFAESKYYDLYTSLLKKHGI